MTDEVSEVQSVAHEKIVADGTEVGSTPDHTNHMSEGNGSAYIQETDGVITPFTCCSRGHCIILSHQSDSGGPAGRLISRAQLPAQAALCIDTVSRRDRANGETLPECDSKEVVALIPAITAGLAAI
jgi:hypothetical protein